MAGVSWIEDWPDIEWALDQVESAQVGQELPLLNRRLLAVFQRIHDDFGEAFEQMASLFTSAVYVDGS